MEDWRLRQRTRISGGEIAFDVFGSGAPVVLVHGTPSRSYIWRNVAAALAERHVVHVFDLLGFGESEKHEGIDASIRPSHAPWPSWSSCGDWRHPPSPATT